MLTFLTIYTRVLGGARCLGGYDASTSVLLLGEITNKIESKNDNI